MHVLVFSGDVWHPGAIVRNGLKKLQVKDIQFDWAINVEESWFERLSDYDLIILAKANHISETNDTPWVTEKKEKVLLNYIHQGGGLLLIHSGLVDYPRNSIVRNLSGGGFTEHPEQCEVSMEPFEGHPLTLNSIAFAEEDEHYFISLEDDDADIFLLTTSIHGTQPGGWRRTEGKGRVCALTPSHNNEGWLNTSFQILLLNVIRWCGTST